jgi:hypothetical protein
MVWLETVVYRSCITAFVYSQCLIYYEYAFPETDEEQKTLDQLRLDCLLNIANCKLRTQQFDDVVENCTLVRCAAIFVRTVSC